MAERLVALGCSPSSCCCTAHSSSSSQWRVSWALPARNATWVSSTGFRTAEFTLSCTGLSTNAFKHRGVQQRRRHLLKVRAAAGPDDGVKWWEKDGGPNMRDIHSTQEFIDALANAGDKLVIVEFFASWCGSCRALYPKLCKLAEEHREIEFLKVNFDENKPMCKRLNVKVLPYFHFYRGADGRLDHFSCSLAKLQKLKDAMQLHNTERCSLGPALGVGDLLSTSTSTPDQTAAAGSTR